MRKLHVACLLAGTLTATIRMEAQSDPHTMKAVGTIDTRFQSYNVEMVEVIGGRFWKPYTSTAVKDMPTSPGLTGVDPSLYEKRTPVDLSDPRLRKLAIALGPAYLRVSGSWANTVYFQDSEAPAPAQPPQGFGGVLTRAEWKGVADFAKATGSKIVTSFSITAGTRDASGVWTPTQAEAFLHYTNSIGAPVAAAEFINEPTFIDIAGVPKGYDGAAYGRDFAVFKPVFRKDAPGALLLGPGSVGEGVPLAGGGLRLLPTDQLLNGTGAAGVDVFSYHMYPAVSERCAAHAPASMHIGTSPEEALTDEFLTRTDTVEQYYAGLRDKFAAGRPIWLTETGQAACGGDRWAATYLDSFRYLYQLGTLARRNVQVVMHNTLDASDYGLIDERNLVPRPNYWAALLWHDLMGTTVLDAGTGTNARLKVFAQCTRDQPGKVTMLLLNLDAKTPATITLPERAERYTLASPELQGSTVLLNGSALALTPEGDVPRIAGTSVPKGVATLAPASITFLVADAANSACR